MTIQKKAAKLGEQGDQDAKYVINNTDYNSSELVSTAAKKPVQASRLLTAIECHTKKARALNYLAGESKDAALNLLQQHHGAMRVIVCRRYA